MPKQQQNVSGFLSQIIAAVSGLPQCAAICLILFTICASDKHNKLAAGRPLYANGVKRTVFRIHNYFLQSFLESRAELPTDCEMDPHFTTIHKQLSAIYRKNPQYRSPSFKTEAGARSLIFQSFLRITPLILTHAENL